MFLENHVDSKAEQSAEHRTIADDFKGRISDEQVLLIFHTVKFIEL